MATRTYPSPAVVREVVSNRYFLSCVYRGAGALDLETLLDVTDDSFQTYDALRYEHGEKGEEDEDDVGDDDDEDDVPDFDEIMDEAADEDEEEGDGNDDADSDLVEQRLTIPLYLPRGFVWEVVHVDNGEEAGVVHQISAPGAEPVRFATLDAHPTGHAMRWDEAERLMRALEADPRNAAANVVALAPLLVWSAVGVGDADDRGAIRARLAEAWRQAGVSAEVADQIALESSRRRATRLGASATHESFAQLLAATSR